MTATTASSPLATRSSTSMSDFRDEDFATFSERERRPRDFAGGLGIPAGASRYHREDAGNGGFGPRRP